MNRFRFRVRDKKHNTWVNANIVLDHSGLLLWSFAGACSLINDPERYDVQFSTGLQDKQGKEIFEGDVCKTLSGFVVSIEWDKDWASFCIRYIKPTFETRQIGFRDFEIIGNIWENPELMEKPQE